MNPLPRIIGESIIFAAHGRNFQVKRLRRDCLHLRDLAVSSRSRFGTATQIREDLAHVETYGYLPYPGPRW